VGSSLRRVVAVPKSLFAMVQAGEVRIQAISRHIVPVLVGVTDAVTDGVPGKTVPKMGILQAFATDPDWTENPFWMLNVLQYKDEHKYNEYSRAMAEEVLPRTGARVVFSGYARTVIGRKEYHHVAIVEYPSPQAFLQMAASPQMMEKNHLRLQGLAEQYLIPMRPGWFRIDRPAPPASKSITSFNAETAWSIPNGMIGAAVTGARVGETSSTRAQAEAFATDGRLAPPAGPLWHLNLLRFDGSAGRETYERYARAMGRKDGVLAQYGARSTLSTACYKSLIGDEDFDQSIIVEYPSRDHFMTMATSHAYMQAAHLRHQGLKETYIISCLPELTDKSSMRVA